MNSSSPPPIEGDGNDSQPSSPVKEVVDSSERNSDQEPEVELGHKTDTSSSSSSEGNEKTDGGGGGDDREAPPIWKSIEKMKEEESWIKQDSSERKSSRSPPPVLLFATKLDSADVGSNRAVLKASHQKMKDALSLTEKYKKIPYIRVLAKDPQKREHHLRFSRYDDVQQGAFILHHEWAQIVAQNGLKEGDEIFGKGCYVDNQFRVVLSFKKKNDSNVSRERNSLPPEKKKGQERSIFLFEKKMDGGDLKQQLAIDCCSQKLKIALQLTMEPYIIMMAGDGTGNYYVLRFSRGVEEGTFVLGHEWDRVVATHVLEEGDLVTGTGYVLNHGSTTVLHFIKKGEMEVAIPEKKVLFFFYKKLESLDTNTLLNRLVIESYKGVVKEMVEKTEKVDDEYCDGYVRVLATDEAGREYELRLSQYMPKGSYALHHEWRDVVIDNGLICGDMITCWGDLAEDCTIKMRIDVCKAIENV